MIPYCAHGTADARIFPPGSLVWVRIPGGTQDEVDAMAARLRVISDEAPTGHFIVSANCYDPTLVDEPSERELVEQVLVSRRSGSAQDQIAKLRERYWIVRKPD